MALEKFIKGKKDSGKHEGKASTVRREQEARQKLKDYYSGVDNESTAQYIVRVVARRIGQSRKAAAE